MATIGVGRACVFLVLLHTTFSQSYSVPDVTIEVFSPKGVKVSIPDAPGLSLFAIHGNVNREINTNSVGTLKGEVLKATGGRWSYEDPNLALKVGDTIYYYVYVAVNRVGYVKDNLTYKVLQIDNRFGDNPGTGDDPVTTGPIECLPTVTRVNRGRVCGGQTIFEDNFTSLRENKWKIEHYIPKTHPEHPFVSYQRSRVSVGNGYLHIAPKVQQSLPGFDSDFIASGYLDLAAECTKPEECVQQAEDANILPPIASGRITSDFAFVYGVVTVRAKLPLGDWLYPEILLEPFAKKYGYSPYASGVLKIATARGNRELRMGSDKYGNKVLYGGPIMDLQCRSRLLDRNTLMDGNAWADAFHNYSVTWTPQSISLSVDGEEWMRMSTPPALHAQFPRDACPAVQHAKFQARDNIAPFDDLFQIVFGVAAGGTTDFHDGTISTTGSIKPWRNKSAKAMLTFWQDLANWESTWNNPELLIDYVRVVAL